MRCVQEENSTTCQQVTTKHLIRDEYAYRQDQYMKFIGKLHMRVPVNNGIVNPLEQKAWTNTRDLDARTVVTNVIIHTLRQEAWRSTKSLDTEEIVFTVATRLPIGHVQGNMWSQDMKTNVTTVIAKTLKGEVLRGLQNLSRRPAVVVITNAFRKRNWSKHKNLDHGNTCSLCETRSFGGMN